LLVDLALGKTLDRAYAIDDAEIEAELDGYPEKKKDYPGRSIAALRAAIDDFRAKRAAGTITDEMLAQAHAEALAVRTSGGSGDEHAAEGQVQTEAPAADDGKVLIKLH
jgi:NifU-like N terminal domain